VIAVTHQLALANVDILLRAKKNRQVTSTFTREVVNEVTGSKTNLAQVRSGTRVSAIFEILSTSIIRKSLSPQCYALESVTYVGQAAESGHYRFGNKKD